MAVAPTITVGGSITGLIQASDIRVSSVNHALGGSPGAAVLEIPSYRPHQMSDTAGATVQVSLEGSRIFTGYVFQARYNEGPSAAQVDLFAFDDRVLLNRQYLGNPESYDFSRVGFDMVFNKESKPDRHPTKLEWYRNQKTAVFWSIGDIINYIAKHYVDEFSGLTMAQNLFSAAAYINNFPGEVSFVGTTIASALDELMQLLGKETWAVDYTSNVVYRVSQDDPGTAQEIYYMTTDGALPDAPVSSNYDFMSDGTRSYEQVSAVSNPVQIETTLVTGIDLVVDTGYKAAQYYRRYRPRTSDPSPPLGIDSAWLTLPWSTGLVTRVDDDWSAYHTQGEVENEPLIGSPVPDRECIWVRTATSGDDWLRVKDGYEIEYDPPGFYVEREVKYYTGNLEEDSTQPDQPVEEKSPEVKTLDLSKTSADFSITINVLVINQVYGQAEENTLPFYTTFAKMILANQLNALYRHNSKMPVLQDSAEERYKPGQDDMPTGWYSYPKNKLDAQAAGLLEGAKLMQRELIADLEMPIFMFLGQRVLWKASGGGSMSPDPLICTGLDWYFGDDRMSLKVRAENQLAGQYSGRSMTSVEMLTLWRAKDLGRVSLLERLMEETEPDLTPQKAWWGGDESEPGGIQWDAPLAPNERRGL